MPDAPPTAADFALSAFSAASSIDVPSAHLSPAPFPPDASSFANSSRNAARSASNARIFASARSTASRFNASVSSAARSAFD